MLFVVAVMHRSSSLFWSFLLVCLLSWEKTPLLAVCSCSHAQIIFILVCLFVISLQSWKTHTQKCTSLCCLQLPSCTNHLYLWVFWYVCLLSWKDMPHIVVCSCSHKLITFTFLVFLSVCFEKQKHLSLLFVWHRSFLFLFVRLLSWENSYNSLHVVGCCSHAVSPWEGEAGQHHGLWRGRGQNSPWTCAQTPGNTSPWAWPIWWMWVNLLPSLCLFCLNNVIINYFFCVHVFCLFWVCAFDRVDVPCVCSHSWWGLRGAIQLFVVFVWCLLSVN